MVYLLNPLRVTELKGTGINWFEDAMFHGGQLLPFRDGSDVVDADSELRLWRNVYHVPHVIYPESTASLVVGEEAWASLRPIVQATARPVQFAKCFSYPFSVAEGSSWSEWPSDWEDYIEFVKTLPDAPAPTTKHYELRLGSLRRAEADGTPMHGLDRFGVYERVTYDPAMAERAGMLDSPRGYLCSERVTAVLRKFVDERFFRFDAVETA